MRFVLVCLVMVGCQLPEPQPYRFEPMDGGGAPPYSADAEPVPDVPERAACGRMCEHMQILGCPLGKPTPQRHEPCLSWCTRVQSKHEIDVHPDCIAQVTNCDAVSDCAN